jgi:predicted DNA-binding transcriptional regulator AlpA
MSDHNDKPIATPSQLVRHKQFADRLGVHTRTVDRWAAMGILPQPVRIRGHKYWPADVEPRGDGEPA